jgi:hypothetical protein
MCRVLESMPPCLDQAMPRAWISRTHCHTGQAVPLPDGWAAQQQPSLNLREMEAACPVPRRSNPVASVPPHSQQVRLSSTPED